MIFRNLALTLVAFVALHDVCYVLAATVHIYVSPTGSDSNSGLDVSHPLRTILKARDKLGAQAIKGNEVFVELRKGYHDLSATLTLTHNYPAPITFRAYNNEEVHVTGGKRINSNLFKPVTDSAVLKRIPLEAHSKVRQVHLSDAGIKDYGSLSVYGFYSRRTAPLEIFINGQPLRLAEWPNKNFINIATVPNGRDGTTFTHHTTRDSKWVGEKDPWVYGFWYWSWADHSAQVAHIDSHAHRITLKAKTHYGLRTGSLRTDGTLNGYSKQGGYFRVINILSELDSPGEYYVDRSTGILYLWPNTHSGTIQSSDVVYASIIKDCISLSHGVSNINFQGFTLEACRRYGITANGGHNLKFTNLEVKNTGTFGISCSNDCRSTTISKCDIHDTDGAIKISGGDRKKLISSGNIIEDNRLWNFGRATAVGADGIALGGVNIIIRNNYIHHGTYSCIKWSGNDHIMENNHFHDCCHATSDCGAIHSGRDWTSRGTIIRNNYIHNTVRYWPGAEIRGVMLDDQFSGANIEHNIFASNEVHVNIGGGRDTMIYYNVFYDSSSGAIDVDGRGISGGTNTATLENTLKGVPYTGALWASKYPKLAAMAHSKNRGAPEGNKIYHNLYYLRNGKHSINYHGSFLMTNTYFDHVDNHGASKSDFYSPEHNNFELRCYARDWANSANFAQPVSYDKVGPRHPYGPYYINKGHSVINHVSSAVTTGSCTKPAPPPDSNNTTQSGPVGCWIRVTKCPADETVNGYFYDSWGVPNLATNIDVWECHGRAEYYWKKCGSHTIYPVTAFHQPTTRTKTVP